MAAATSSFPVPLSPSISTGESAGATRTIMPFSASIAGETLDQLAHAQLLAQAAPQRVDLLAEQAALQDVVQQVAELLEHEGLREVVVRAQLQRLHRGRHGGIARHHEDLDRRIVPLEVPEELHPVHLRQVDVHHRDLEELGLEQLDGPGAGRHDHDRLVSPPAEHLREKLAKCVVILHHQDVQALHQRLTGSAGGRVRTRTLPRARREAGPRRAGRAPGPARGTPPPSRQHRR